MQGLESLLVVTLVAALTPMIVAALPGPGLPQVVILILAGVLIGPQGLGLAETTGIQLLANVGLGFLFLLAGYELDPRLLRAHERDDSRLVVACAPPAMRLWKQAHDRLRLWHDPLPARESPAAFSIHGPDPRPSPERAPPPAPVCGLCRRRQDLRALIGR